MKIDDLEEIAKCINVPLPLQVSCTVGMLGLGLPKTDDSQWKKINVTNSVREAKKALDQFMENLSARSKRSTLHRLR